MTVHHNPKSIANVLSLKSVALRHHTTYDSKHRGGVFKVYTPGGVVEFKPSEPWALLPWHGWACKTFWTQSSQPQGELVGNSDRNSIKFHFSSDFGPFFPVMLSFSIFFRSEFRSGGNVFRWRPSLYSIFPRRVYSSYIDKLRNFLEFRFAASHMVGDFRNFPTEFPRTQNSRIGIPI